MVKVAILDRSHAAAYDAYVAAHADASFFHQRFFTDILSEVAGHHINYLVAWRGREITGILPLALRKSLFFGKRADSLPFAVYAGPIADDEMALGALCEAAFDHSAAFGAPELLLHFKNMPKADLPGWQAVPGASSFERRMADHEEQRLMQIPRKQRAVIRKSLSAGLEISYGLDQFDLFYHLYACSLRALGTPVFSKRLLYALAMRAGQACDISVVRIADGTPVASLMSFYHRDRVMPYYAGGISAARSSGAHDFMYFNLMNRAYARGARIFDFGRSRDDSGPYRFKKNWGFQAHPLAYHAKLAETGSVSDLSPVNPKFALAMALWRRMPLWLTKLLGPPLANHLG